MKVETCVVLFFPNFLSELKLKSLKIVLINKASLIFFSNFIIIIQKTKTIGILIVKLLLFVHTQNTIDGTMYFFIIHFDPQRFILYNLILIEGQLLLIS